MTIEQGKILDELKDLLAERRFIELRKLLLEQHEKDIADFLDELSPDTAALLFRMLRKDQAAEVFAYLDNDSQEFLISAFSDQEVSEMIETLYLDDAVDMIEELPANAVNRVLQLATPQTRKLINHYLKYPEDSAGSIMTSEYTRLTKGMTVKEAIEYIRHYGEDRETIYTCYVTSASRILEGVVTVRDLLLSDDDDLVKDIMDPDVIKVYTTEDQERVALLFHHYDFLALPVVDIEKRLVGIVTIDDALDVVHEEATEDFEIMAAMSPSEKPYLKTSVWEHAKNRSTWLFVLMISATISGAILNRYENAFMVLPVLVTFMPMLTDTGGNAGSQSSTLIIRGMALDEIKFSDLGIVIWKEFRIGILVGLGLAIVNFLRIYFLIKVSFPVALVVSLALFITVILSKLTGSILPVLARAVNLDPAIMAAPLITTIVDAAALILYFQIASRLLHISI